MGIWAVVVCENQKRIFFQKKREMRAKLETLLSPHLLCDRLHENYADVAVVVPDPANKNPGVGPGVPSTDRFEAGGLGWNDSVN